MANKYLEKVAAMIRSVENLVSKTDKLAKGILGRERRVNMGLTTKPEPVKAQAALATLKDQSAKKLWK